MHTYASSRLISTNWHKFSVKTNGGKVRANLVHTVYSKENVPKSTISSVVYTFTEKQKAGTNDDDARYTIPSYIKSSKWAFNTSLSSTRNLILSVFKNIKHLKHAKQYDLESFLHNV